MFKPQFSKYPFLEHGQDPVDFSLFTIFHVIKNLHSLGENPEALGKSKELTQSFLFKNFTA